mmetsp:Transcript_29851/g.68791  ORF Transcript_29851/g.68791 Transcript_29851/m.68791 type:complete len:201 (+) Transcript_29851:641-1243(+)
MNAFLKSANHHQGVTIMGHGVAPASSSLIGFPEQPDTFLHAFRVTRHTGVKASPNLITQVRPQYRRLPQVVRIRIRQFLSHTLLLVRISHVLCASFQHLHLGRNRFLPLQLRTGGLCFTLNPERVIRLPMTTIMTFCTPCWWCLVEVPICRCLYVIPCTLCDCYAIHAIRRRSTHLPAMCQLDYVHFGTCFAQALVADNL